MPLRFSNLSLVAWIATAVSASSLPFQDGVLTVDSRQFYIGTPVRPVGTNERDWPFNDSDWLAEFIDADPVLSEYRIFLHQTGVPAIDLVKQRTVVGGVVPLLATDPRLQIHMLETYGEPGYLQFYSLDSDIQYQVTCTGPPDTGFRYCGIRVVYPLGQNISLVAKRFFPGTLDEIGVSFDGIARRMVEVALCLDVTNRSPDNWPSQPKDILNESPSLDDCEISLTS